MHGLSKRTFGQNWVILIGHIPGSVLWRRGFGCPCGSPSRRTIQVCSPGIKGLLANNSRCDRMSSGTGFTGFAGLWLGSIGITPGTWTRLAMVHPDQTLKFERIRVSHLKIRQCERETKISSRKFWQECCFFLRKCPPLPTIWTACNLSQGAKELESIL